MGNDWGRVLDVLAAADEESWNLMSDSRWCRLVDLMARGRLHRVQSEVTNRLWAYRRRLAGLD